MCIKEGKASVKVLVTDEKWYGMTYREDLAKVRAAVDGLKRAGIYPKMLWR